MNERMKELIEQAGMTLKPRRPLYDEEPGGYLESDNDYFQNNLRATREFFDGGLEKFAELIVRECLKANFDAIDELKKDPECNITSGWKTFMALAEVTCRNKIAEQLGVE
jgi:hypothetical protein